MWPVYFRMPNCFLYAFPKFTAKDSTFFLITLWWCKCGRIHFIISFRNETDIKDLFRSICQTLIIIIPLIQMHSDLSELLYKFPKRNRYQRFIQIDLSIPNYNNTVNSDALRLIRVLYVSELVWYHNIIGFEQLRVYCSFYGCYISFKRFSAENSYKTWLRYENSPLILTFTLHCPKTFATFCLNTRVINRARDFWGLFKTVYGPDLPRTSICKCTF